jgi:hypothetical protein
MAKLIKCSRCKSEIDDSYFGLNRKKELYKTCINCRKKTSYKDEFVNHNVCKIIFDVEHSGCSMSYIIQLSWFIYDENNTLLEKHNYYRKPEDDLYISPYSTEKTGITIETLYEKGELNIKQILKIFCYDVEKCDLLISHNIKSDLSTINKELVRCELAPITKPLYCSMNESKKYCNKKNKINGLKPPTLQELYYVLFKENCDSSKLHNSLFDVEICAKCYFELMRLNITKNSLPLISETPVFNTIEKEPPKPNVFKFNKSIDATDIATIIGHHNFDKDIPKRIFKYWERNFRDDYMKVYYKVLLESTHDKNLSKIDKKENIEDKIFKICYNNNLETDFSCSEKVDETLTKIKDIIKSKEETEIEEKEETNETDETHKTEIEEKEETNETHKTEIEEKEETNETDETHKTEIEEKEETNETDETDDLIETKTKTCKSFIKEKDLISFVNKQMGIKCEKEALQQLENDMGVKVERTNNRRIERKFYTTDKNKWFVIGKADGLIDDKTVVEVKTRKKCIYNKTFENEEIQMNTYMYILNLEKAILLQYKDSTMKITDLEYKKNWYEEKILTKLKYFCDKMEELMVNEDIKKKLMEIRLEELDEEDEFKKCRLILKQFY